MRMTLCAARALGRVLEPQELVGVVEEIAARPSSWRDHEPPVDGQRHYASLHRDDNVDVWAIFWMPENDTGWHDHDVSSGAVRIVRGTLQEHAMCIGGERPPRLYSAGASFSFGPTHIHRLTCAQPSTVSIHAYSPPLWRLGQYAVSNGGTLRRVSISYADELRPIEVA